MRVVRLRLNRDVNKYLRSVAKQFGFDDPGFVQDMFAFIRLKGTGLPSQDRIDKMAQYAAKRYKDVNEKGIRLLIGKRKHIMSELSKLPYFVGLCGMKDPIDATERLILHFKELYNKARQSACMSCGLRANCEFGKQYGEMVKKISVVIDADYKKKTHPDCPALPDIDGLNQFHQAIQTMGLLSAPSDENNLGADIKGNNGQDEMEELQEDEKTMPPEATEEGDEDAAEEEGLDPEDEAEDYDPFSGGCSRGRAGVYDGSNNFSPLVRHSEDLIKKVSISKLMIFDLGNKFVKGLEKAAKGKFKPVPQVAPDKRAATIESMSDLPKIEGSQHGLPDEVFDQRLAKKSLVKKQNVKPEDTKKILYLLTDNTGSMNTQVGGENNPFRLFTRGAMAALFSLAICDRVRDDGGHLFHRFFCTYPAQLKQARTKDEFKELRSHMLSASYNIGGTDIVTAIKVALSDIKAANGDMRYAEILMITDAEDNFILDDIQQVVKSSGIEFNVLDVCGEPPKLPGQVVMPPSERRGAALLKLVATRYYKADHREADIEKMVKLV